ncbi:hypothetical protein ACTXT7_014989 [Hymenolepis weldensis]
MEKINVFSIHLVSKPLQTPPLITRLKIYDLETETSLLGEISTLRELFIALSTATEDPNCLLEEAESVLARTGAATGDSGVSMTPSGALHSPSTNEVEAFASAVEAIMSSRQQRQQQNKHMEGSPSLASDSLGSTSSGWSDSGNGANGPGSSPISSQVSIHSANSGPQHQMAAILRQSRLPQLALFTCDSATANMLLTQLVLTVESLSLVNYRFPRLSHLPCPSSLLLS